MATLPRVTQPIFAGSATNNGQFGSAQAGTKITSNDLPTLMSLAAWAAGWNNAVVSGRNLPPLEEFQAINYIITTQLAYMFQEGIPEYDTGTAYRTNSFVKKPGTSQVYISKLDSNTNNALTNTTYWKAGLDLSAAATYLLASNNLSDLASLAIALTNLGFVNSLNSPGYQKLPGGLILQWGTYSFSASTTTTATFPLTFPTAPLAGGGFNGNTIVTVATTALSTTTISLSASSSTSTTGYYIVLGK